MPKVTGIIAELNPLHNGHVYAMETAGKMTSADGIVAVISGNYTQRGEPALIDKHLRARMALMHGADLVLEMPLFGAVGSAADFAMAGVGTLMAAGIVTDLCFGSECGSLDDLLALRTALSDHGKLLDQGIRENLAAGLSWPAARQQAAKQLDLPGAALLKNPNDLLGIEYLGVLDMMNAVSAQPHITPHAFRRIGSEHRQSCIPDSAEQPSVVFTSASSIREALKHTEAQDQIRPFVPSEVFDVLTRAADMHALLYTDDFSEALMMRLIGETSSSLTAYADMDEALANRICTLFEDYTGMEAFTQHVVHRAYTASRVRRAMMHVLLDLKESDRRLFKEAQGCPWLRVLGFRKDHEWMLRRIAADGSRPLILSPARDRARLDDPGIRRLFEAEAYADRIYNTIKACKTGRVQPHEYRIPVCVI